MRAPRTQKVAAIDNTAHIEEQLSAYIDGELSPPERAQVEAHLAVCSMCRAEYEGLKHVTELASDSLRSVHCISDADRAAYVNDLLDEAKHREVEEHLKRCKSCRADIEQLRHWLSEAPMPAHEHAAAAKPRKHLYRYISVYTPLAAAAAIVVAVISMMLPKDDIQPPSITGLTVRTAAVRADQPQGDISVPFGERCVLRTNDQIRFSLHAGSYRHAVVFCVLPSGEVAKVVRHDSLSGSIQLPENGLWRLASTIGTEAIIIAFSREPLTDEDVATAKRVLSQAGDMPQLPYGSIWWLERHGNWASNGPVDEAVVDLDARVTALRKALANRAPVFQGIAYDHQ